MTLADFDHRPPWRDVFLDIAERAARRSHDAQTQVGCVLATANNRIRGIGFNGFPHGMRDGELPNTRPHKYPLIRHAERNAIKNSNGPTEGCVAYVTGPPCNDCLMEMWEHGVSRVVHYEASGGFLDPNFYDTSVRSVILDHTGMVLEPVHRPARGIYDAKNLATELDKVRESGKTTVMVSGGFAPAHIGHLRMVQEAKSLGGLLVVVVNGDGFLQRKKGFVFMPLSERMEMMMGLGADYVTGWDDGTQFVDGAIRLLKPDVFANGGDRSRPDQMAPCELEACAAVGCRVVGGVGGEEKVQSSSNLAMRLRSPSF